VEQVGLFVVIRCKDDIENSVLKGFFPFTVVFLDALGIVNLLVKLVDIQVLLFV
jgi:hypothetical protein